jgi:hypothetical protein
MMKVNSDFLRDHPQDTTIMKVPLRLLLNWMRRQFNGFESWQDHDMRHVTTKAKKHTLALNLQQFRSKHGAKWTIYPALGDSSRPFYVRSDLDRSSML